MEAMMTKIDPREHMRMDPMERPMTPMEMMALYMWKGDEEDCPDDLYVNASTQPIIIGAQAQIPFDNGKIMPGDRVMGAYYGECARVPMFTGLMQVKKVPMERLVELERMRKLRTGDEPEEWVKEAWKKLPEETRKKMGMEV
jgi:hypothetical protein